MYNIDFLPQLRESERHLFGPFDNSLAVSHEKYCRPYFLPPGLEILECVEASNGEWVPAEALEGIADS